MSERLRRGLFVYSREINKNHVEIDKKFVSACNALLKMAAENCNDWLGRDFSKMFLA